MAQSGSGLLAQLMSASGGDGPSNYSRLPFRENLALLLNSGNPLLYIETFEEQRVIAEIEAVVADAKAVRNPRKVYTWSYTEGFRKPDGSTVTDTIKAVNGLTQAQKLDEPAVAIFRDLHADFGEGGHPSDVVAIRKLRDIAHDFRFGRTPRSLIIIAPQLDIPPDLEKDVTLVSFPLPDEKEIRSALDSLIKSYQQAGLLNLQLDEIGLEKLAKAANGLTLSEATNAFTKAIADGWKLDDSSLQMVLDEKRQTVRKSGVMDSIPVDISLSDVGGLENLKRWLHQRNGSWLDSAAKYGLPAPKGALIVGVPGCGKSLTAKAVSGAWGLPLLSLDIGKLFTGLVGFSERNMRQAISVAEASAPCVLWIDEVEKGFSGVGSNSDSGTSTRVFGEFLSWMQEKTAPVFVIATANEVDKLPPEFLRKGRFDEIFFVDLPTPRERVAVWKVQLHHYLDGCPAGENLTLNDDLYQRLAEVSAGFSGSEIESAVTSAMYTAYGANRAVDEQDLVHALKTTVPLSTTDAEQISAIRNWANTRAVAATAKEDQDVAPGGDDVGGRRIDY